MDLGDREFPSLETQRRWYLAVLLCAATVLPAFWHLLEYRFSPKNYLTVYQCPGNTEIAWFVAAVASAVSGAVWFRRNLALCRGAVLGALPLVGASVYIIGKGVTGVRIAYADPLLFATAAGWALPLAHRFAHRDLNASAGTRQPGRGIRVWAILLWVGVAAYGLYLFAQQVGYWQDLALGFSDCGQMARLMHNTLHNSPELFLRDDPAKPMFFDHFQPGVLPFIPLWYLWPDMELLILFQVVALLGLTVPLYRIGCNVMRDRVAAGLLVGVWLVYPSLSQLVYNGSYGFRWGSFCLPLYFVALACWLEGKPRQALAAAVWAVLIKEEAAVVVGTFGLYLAVFEGRRRAGLVLAGAGFAYFLLVSSVLVPALHGGDYIVQGYFSGLGRTKLQILLSPVTRPQVFWTRLLEAPTFLLAGTLLAPLLFLPLREVRTLFGGSIVFFFVCLWDKPLGKSICFQYQAGLLPILFLALARATRDHGEHTLPGTPRTRLVGAIVSGTLLSVFLGNTFWSKETIAIARAPGRLALVDRMKARIDPSARLVATQRVAAHFTAQKHLHILGGPLPAEVDAVLLDLRQRWEPMPAEDEIRRLRDCQRAVEAHPALRLIAAEDGLLLYARTGHPLDMQAVAECQAPPADTSRRQPLGNGVWLEAIELVPEPPSASPRGYARVTVKAWSRAERRTDVDLALLLLLRFPDDTPGVEAFSTPLQPLGRGVWPTYRWTPGAFHLDEFHLDLPADLVAKPVQFAPLPTVLSRVDDSNPVGLPP